VVGRKLPARRGGGSGVVKSLTGTEREIVRLVADGNSNFEVAAILGLSPRTVETYRLRLMKKLDIEGLPSLIKYAIRTGITTLD
jgi:DNA-binding CsgD family transcriptional regulator